MAGADGASRRLARLAHDASRLVRLIRFGLINRRSARRVTGTADVVVNLTSYGDRVTSVHLAIESIVAGTIRPERLILWIDDAEILAHPPGSLERLRRRGLEILRTDDHGPHKKQYAFACMTDRPPTPLVAADDDVLYPRRWLEGLVAAHRRDPDVVAGYRARTIPIDAMGVEPYESWPLARTTVASFDIICTGVSGIIYPPRLLDLLKRASDEFLSVAPTSDDIWVHLIANRNGIRSRQIEAEPREFATIPRTQAESLSQRQGNASALGAYEPADVERIRSDIISR